MLIEPLHLGRTLMMMIDALHMTQLEIAKGMGCSPTHLNKICQGKTAMKPSYAVRFEYVTGVSADLLMRIQANHETYLARVEFNRILEERYEWA